MKAVLLERFGGPEVLKVGEAWDPVAGPREAVVAVKACALNHLDLWVREGLPAYRLKMPHILGCDIAGVVESVGEGVTGVAPGDKVVVSPGVSCFRCERCLAGRDNLCATYGILGADGGPGGYAEKVKVQARALLPMPGGLSFEEAASFPLTYLTAYHMLLGQAALKPAQTVLVIGAGSGVGTAAIQIAKDVSARVIATTTDPAKQEHAVKAGADDVVVGTDPFRKVLALTGGEGVDVVFEHVGGEIFSKALRVIKPGGALVTCGATAGGRPVIDLRYVFFKELKVLGVKMGTFDELRTVTRLVSQGKLTPIVAKSFPLEQAAQAHAFLAERKQAGKVVLSV